MQPTSSPAIAASNSPLIAGAIISSKAMPRIPYFPRSDIDDPEIQGFIDEAERIGTPRPEIQLIRAHVPAVIRSFTYTWQNVFKGGIVEHELKELLRVRVARSLDCQF